MMLPKKLFKFIGDSSNGDEEKRFLATISWEDIQTCLTLGGLGASNVITKTLGSS